MSKASKKDILSLFRRWRSLSLLEHVIFALAITLPFLVLAYKLTTVSTAGLILLGAGLAVGCTFWLARRSQWFAAEPSDMAFFLNNNYPELEDSADLLLQEPHQLPPLALRQRQIAMERMASADLELPHKLGQKFLFLLSSLLLSALLLWVPVSGQTLGRVSQSGEDSTIDPVQHDLTPEKPPQLVELTALIQPPSYTGLSATSQQEPDIKAPQGSVVTWKLTFSKEIRDGKITLGDGKSLPLQAASPPSYSASLKLAQTSFYQPAWRGYDDLWQGSEYYKLETIPDQVPKIEVADLPQFAEYPYEPGKEVDFTVDISDDYGISNARMVATLSRGEGESVQFRDDTLHFAQNFGGRQKTYQVQHTLKLDELGMDPGDELYLHIEALDNHEPRPQMAKTSKFIISFENQKATTMDMVGGLAVDRLPEYFRSQRQIIIDTEKLISARGQLETKPFQQQSNNIAIDQKLLRLRYGRFLGEEFQTVIGAIPEEMPSETEDHEEHDGEEVHYSGDGHDHPDDAFSSEDGEIEELEPYVHAHDMSAEATFFDAATKSKLQAALSEMWSAELHLRMGRPEEALPYEYAALKLIKEIQQASRVYVERIGFEPPVFNEAEKRLTGELEDIGSLQRSDAKEEEITYPAIHDALPLLEELLLADRAPAPEERVSLQAAGEELAMLAMEHPGAYLQSLEWLRNVMENADPAKRIDYLKGLQKVFGTLLPDRGLQPLRRDAESGDLRSIYLEEIQRSQ